MGKIQTASRPFAELIGVAAALPLAQGLFMNGACGCLYRRVGATGHRNCCHKPTSILGHNPAHLVEAGDFSSSLKTVIMILGSYFFAERNV